MIGEVPNYEISSVLGYGTFRYILEWFYKRYASNNKTYP